MNKSEEIKLDTVENRDPEIQLGELVSFLGELTMHLGSISRFFQLKTGEQAATPVPSLRSRAIREEINKSLLAIGREVYANSNADPKPVNVTGRIVNLCSRVEILQEIMDEIDGKKPVETATAEAREEASAPPEEEKPEKPEEKPPVKAEDDGPGKAEEDTGTAVRESSSGSQGNGEAAAEDQSPGEGNTKKEVVSESSS